MKTAPLHFSCAHRSRVSRCGDAASSVEPSRAEPSCSNGPIRSARCQSAPPPARHKQARHHPRKGEERRRDRRGRWNKIYPSSPALFFLSLPSPSLRSGASFEFAVRRREVRRQLRGEERRGEEASQSPTRTLTIQSSGTVAATPPAHQYRFVASTTDVARLDATGTDCHSLHSKRESPRCCAHPRPRPIATPTSRQLRHQLHAVPDDTDTREQRTRCRR